MAKIKVYELGKELALESKEVIRRLQKLGFDAKSHMSVVTDKHANMLRQAIYEEGGGGPGSPVPGVFVPTIKRIPKAVIQQEQAEAQAIETLQKEEAERALAPTVETDPIEEIKPDSKAEKSKSEPETKEKPEIKAKSEPKPKPEAKAKPEIKAKPKTKPEAEAKAEEEAKSAPEDKTKAKPARQPDEKPTTPPSQADSLSSAVSPQKSGDKSAPQGISAQSSPPALSPKEQRPAGQTTPSPRSSDPLSARPNRSQQPRQGESRDTRSQQPRQGDNRDNRSQQARQGESKDNRSQQVRQGESRDNRNQQVRQGDNRDNRGQQVRQGDNRDNRGQQVRQGDNRDNRGQQARQGDNRDNRGQQARQGDNRDNRGQGRPGQQPFNRPKTGFTPGGARPQPSDSGRVAAPGGNQAPRGEKKTAYGQGRGSKPTGGKMAIPAPPVVEKQTTNYRPEKKSYTKDMAFERITDKENQRNKNRINKNKRNLPKGHQKQQVIMPPVTPKKVLIGESILVGELARSMAKTAGELIKKLMSMGVMTTINQELDAETAILLGAEFGVAVEVQTDRMVEIMEDVEDEEGLLLERPPIVTVMGHVDHGKTSLLDAIRNTNVIATEAGGITQHIGAYQVEIKAKKITFLDTPGHEAFTAMRARGAQITDISILVVAADDGVMPQTVEAINHSKAAGVPIIVAINKIDKESANPDRVKQELTEHGLLCEEWGGDTVMVPVSAKKGQGIETLLEMILLVAEVAELKANPLRHARGTVVEAQLDKNRGPVATLLVQKGTLNVGDSILAGPAFGKVRAMNDYKGRKVKSAEPSFPVEVLGFSEVPAAGEVFIAVKDDKDARLVAYRQQLKKREDELRKTSKVSLDDLFKQIAEGEVKELNIVLKADVQGSTEALEQALVKLNTDEVKVNVIHSGVGGIKESDVMLASASNAVVIGFNVRPDLNSRKAAETENIDIRLYRVIYDATDDVKKAMAGLLAPQFKENILGHAEVREVFKVPKAGMVAGSYVTDGKITRNAEMRVIRDSVVIVEGKLASLRRFKDDVKEVLSGFECGIGLENFNDIKEGDIIEAFIMEEVERHL